MRFPDISKMCLPAQISAASIIFLWLVEAAAGVFTKLVPGLSGIESLVLQLAFIVSTVAGLGITSIALNALCKWGYGELAWVWTFTTVLSVALYSLEAGAGLLGNERAARRLGVDIAKDIALASAPRTAAKAHRDERRGAALREGNAQRPLKAVTGVLHGYNDTHGKEGWCASYYRPNNSGGFQQAIECERAKITHQK